MNMSKQFSKKIYDQFAFANYGCIDSAQAVLIMRTLQTWGELGEGTLATKVGSRLFRPEWSPLIERLHADGFISFTPTGHGVSRTVALTEKSKEFLEDRGIEPEPVGEKAANA
jgi:hypothetical protein